MPTAAFYIRRCQFGTIDFIEKPFDRTRLLAQIDRCFEQDALRKDRRVRQHQLAEKFARLSVRERETLELLRQGLPNKLIAATLELTERAVEMHCARIMQKLAVHSVAELFEDLASDVGTGLKRGLVILSGFASANHD